MNDQITFEFIPQIVPPAGPAGPAYWFAFQDDKMLMRVVDQRLEAPLAASLAELGLNAIRQQYLGYLQDAGEGQRIDCFSAEVDPAAALAMAW